jgi:hypothetical protein
MNQFIDLLFNSFVDNVNSRPIAPSCPEMNTIDTTIDPTFILNQNIVNNMSEIREYYSLGYPYITQNQNSPSSSLNLSSELSPSELSPSELSPSELSPELSLNSSQTNRLHRYIPIVSMNTSSILSGVYSRNNIRHNGRLTTIPLVNQMNSTNVMSSIMYSIFDEVLNVFENELETSILENIPFVDVKVTLTEEEFNKLKVMKSDDIENALTKQCHICIEDYLPNEDLIYLDCKHYFHKECIQKWLLGSSSKCPICRKKVHEE